MKLMLILFSLIALKTCSDLNETEENNQGNIEGSFLITKVLESNVTDYKLTIDFNDETKQVSGFSGCNRFFGSYALNENILTIGPLASTKMFCQGETNTIEAKLLDELSNVNSFSINGSTLILKTDNNELVTAIPK
jgi:heat shock protein HslJ